ncbi:putative Co/Zn/Cd efflux system membrane fusion protein [Acidisarcina polymorpha]|uniref:Putative Co/Zn/Cd efflux system membrane fusion protein n=1 Tax=Acidisarcina polymorpha TaxID=2211140 RepID=A0A2Z5FT24_9BACT|nr:efflux RND transporter periplasmic adaptor subunit [Acidisarcina polymorpha]AXC09634.1 putative Co/Zn/Cd efflux system membrane fusion protein [Acidisarcina polymorpha]
MKKEWRERYEGIGGMVVLAAVLAVSGCSKSAPAAAPEARALPVQTVTITNSPVPKSDEYTATIKSRRSATLSPQVDGNLTEILVKSGDRVKAGQRMMEIDPAKQQATLDSQVATERQKLAVYHYNEIEVERQRKLFAAGVISRDVLDQAEQSYSNSKADYQAAVSLRESQERQLGYYHIRAPFDGIVGDIPVHLGDYVSPTTMLTTVDENRDFEAYVYIPTERTSEIRNGLGINIVDTDGKLLESTKIDFVAPSVDNGLQGILVKAPLKSEIGKFRTAQLVKARVIWSTSPTATVPVLAITRIGGQAFVYVAEQGDKGTLAKQRAVTLGDTVGNDYAVLGGLKPGEKVIVSGTQFLVDGMPVQPLG